MRFPICCLSGLLLALSLASCSRQNSAGVEVDSRLKGYTLPNSKVLAGVDLDKVKQSGFYQRHRSQLHLEQLNRLSEQIGMDPRRDLSSLLVSWNGTEALAMTRGAFDSAGLERRLRAETQQEKYGKLTLYGDGKHDVVFLSKGVALVGSALLLKKAVGEAASGGGGIPEPLQLQLSRLDRGSQAWLVSSGIIPLDQLSLRSDAATTVSNISDYINATAVGVIFGPGATIDAQISCISEEGSQRVHDALKGVIGLARLSTKDNQLDQLALWDSIHVEKQGKDVHVSTELSPEMADKLVGLLPSLSNRF